MFYKTDKDTLVLLASYTPLGIGSPVIASDAVEAFEVLTDLVHWLVKTSETTHVTKDNGIRWKVRGRNADSIRVSFCIVIGNGTTVELCSATTIRGIVKQLYRAFGPLTDQFIL